MFEWDEWDGVRRVESWNYTFGMEDLDKSCKYCNEQVTDIVAEGLQCTSCSNYVHIKCLKRGSVPGGLFGDVFFDFTCNECSDNGSEIFARQSLSWFQSIVLVLYHMTHKNPGISRTGYFHWRTHLTAQLDKQWETLFSRETKRKKTWTGTVASQLSTNSPQFFTSGTRLFKQGGWWALTYPNLTPFATAQIYQEVIDKQGKFSENLFEIVGDTIQAKDYPEEYTILITEKDFSHAVENENEPLKRALPVEVPETAEPTKAIKASDGYKKQKVKSTDSENVPAAMEVVTLPVEKIQLSVEKSQIRVEKALKEKFTDPMCHYNTSLNDISRTKGIQLKVKLLGGMRDELILSPYSSLYLKPYIRRDSVSFPSWLKLMAELQLKCNANDPHYELPSRHTIDYVYVQPSHIPAINSLCNQFFWPGIELTDCLQYPDFSCVVLYKKLIIGFAFVVPDVRIHENYISFIFVRPGWRNIGIGRFMIYHLIQTSIAKDITLHVSINNPALFLYQKFGFKVERVDLNFYDKYYQANSHESKHAFFCRLER